MNQKTVRILGITAIGAAVCMIAGGIFLLKQDKEPQTMTPSSGVVLGETVDTATACQNLMSAYYQSIVNRDGAALYQLMAPPAYWTYYQEQYDKTTDDIVATYNDAILNTLANWEASCGENVRVAFHIEASAEQSPEFLEEWSTNMNTLIGTDAMEAQEAMTLQVTQKITGASSTEETEITPTLIKVNDVWYILDEGSHTES